MQFKVKGYTGRFESHTTCIASDFSYRRIQNIISVYTCGNTEIWQACFVDCMTLNGLQAVSFVSKHPKCEHEFFTSGCYQTSVLCLDHMQTAKIHLDMFSIFSSYK
jgi:hypothetical protein